MLVLNFNNPDEWTKSIVWNDNISIEEYLEEMPIGYKAEISTALSTTSMSVLIYKRNDITNLSSDTWTVEYGDYNASADRSISVGILASGISILTIYGTGTTALAAGQYIKFRLVTKTGDVYDKMTNWITAKAIV